MSGGPLNAQHFVAGDWGTSHLRLCLCDRDGRILESAEGPGAVAAAGAFEPILDELLSAWRPNRSHGPQLPTVLSGMVGSSIGWLPAPYVECPARLEQLAAACVSPRGGVSIVPGLSCRNRYRAPDVMRGEETQILGALSLHPGLRRGRRLLCLPGTHTKWARLSEGTVAEFLTSPTGELFALLREHSVLLRDAALPARDHANAPDESVPPGAGEFDAAAFNEGLAQLLRFPQAPLLHRLFECRARRLNGELGAQGSADFLSGLLIASDVNGAVRLLAARAEADGEAQGEGNANASADADRVRDAPHTVHLIGAPQLMQRYASVLAAHGQEFDTIDGDAAAMAGLAQVHRQLTERPLAHAVR
jgi:2-dehydro-3-deoxygalactonokinase